MVYIHYILIPLRFIMTQLEKINLIKTLPDRIFFFDDDKFYTIYDGNFYWFYKKLQPIKVNIISNKKKGLFTIYGSIPKASLVYLKDEYAAEFKEIKMHKYGFSIDGIIDEKEYVIWRDSYQKK